MKNIKRITAILIIFTAFVFVSPQAKAQTAPPPNNGNGGAGGGNTPVGGGAPIGGGLLILASMGAAYAYGKMTLTQIKVQTDD